MLCLPFEIGLANRSGGESGELEVDFALHQSEKIRYSALPFITP